MSIAKIIRAWKDREYRESLSEEERAKLLENPVGQIELAKDELTMVVGGLNTGKHNFCKKTQALNLTCFP